MKILRRIVAEIEMMSINDEITDKELTDYIKHVLNYQNMLKIKEKEEEQKKQNVKVIIKKLPKLQ